MATVKQNTVYLYRDGKTESFDAGFGYRSVELEMEQTMREHCQDRLKSGLPEPVTLLFVQEGNVLSFWNNGMCRLVTSILLIALLSMQSCSRLTYAQRSNSVHHLCTGR